MRKTAGIVDLAITLVFAMAIAGCASGPRFGGAIQLVPNAEILVVRATARQEPDGFAVGGDVRRTNGFAGAVPGHLEVVARDREGRIVASTSTSWGEFKNRRFRLAYFTTILRTPNPSAIATIRIEPVTP